MFSNDELKKISKLPESVLREKITLALKASGNSPDNVNISTQDINKLKTMLSGLSDKDVEKIMSSVPRETVESIKQKLEESM